MENTPCTQFVDVAEGDIEVFAFALLFTEALIRNDIDLISEMIVEFKDDSEILLVFLDLAEVANAIPVTVLIAGILAYQHGFVFDDILVDEVIDFIYPDNDLANERLVVNA